MKTPQRLSHDAVAEFKMIYQEEFGDNISDDEAQEMGLRLLTLLGILLKRREVADMAHE